MKLLLYIGKCKEVVLCIGGTRKTNQSSDIVQEVYAQLNTL